MTTVYLAWRDPGRRWFPVGRLIRDEAGSYEFVYTQGAIEAHKQSEFLPLVAFPEFSEVYRSHELFPVFSNRLLSDRRPEFNDFVSWLNLLPNERDPLVILARSSGERATDTFEVFPCPEPDSEGRFNVLCFVHGLQHREPEAIERAERLRIGEPLRIEADPENPADCLALKALTADERPVHVGFLPRYLNADVRTLGLDSVRATVERVNPRPTPIQFRLLVRLIGPWPQGFEPCNGALYRPIPEMQPEGLS